MPFARGPSLQNRIDRSGPLSALEVVRIGKQIASGLVAAHEQGLVHRDIKPANILLNEGIERLWITDFGVARAMDDASMTKTGVIAGTPQYMSPEQARGESVDHRSDLFSLGSILYTACTGRPPFRSEAAYGVLRRITDTDPRPIREISPDIPDWLCVVIRRLMAKHPSDRYQSAKEVARLLEACLAHLQQPEQVELPECIASIPIQSREESVSSMAAVEQPKNQPSLSRTMNGGVIVMISAILIAATGFVAMELTSPVNVSGSWQGESWKNVTMKTTEEAPGWYSGTFADAKGNPGVLHLEWSRTQRRFHGRWQVGSDRSGQITLRPIGKSEIRGAVSVDPTTKTDPSIARLRDFTWQRGDPQSFQPQRNDSVDVVQAEVIKSGSTVVRSPKKGVLTALGNRLRTSERVEPGDTIAVISLVDLEADPQLQRMLDVVELRVEGEKELLVAKERELGIVAESVDAARLRLQEYEVGVYQIEESADAEADAAKSKARDMSAQEKQFREALHLAEEELDSMENAEGGAVAQDKLQQVKAKIAKTKAKVHEINLISEAAESEWKNKRLEIEAKKQQARARLSDVAAELRTAEAGLARTESQIIELRTKLRASMHEMQGIQSKLDELSRVEITAPRAGMVAQVTIAEVGASVDEGDVICVIDSEQETPPSAEDQSAESFRRAKQNASESRGEGPPLPLEDILPELNDVSPQLIRESNQIGDLSRELGTTKQLIEQSIVDERKVLQQIADMRSQMASQLESDESGETRTNPGVKNELRLQWLHTNLRDLEAVSKKLREKQAELERKLKQATLHHNAIIRILENRRQSAAEILASEEQIHGKVQSAHDAGLRSRWDLLRTEQSVSEKRSKLREIDLVLEYYRRLTEDSQPE